MVRLISWAVYPNEFPLFKGRKPLRGGFAWTRLFVGSAVEEKPCEICNGAVKTAFFSATRPLLNKIKYQLIVPVTEKSRDKQVSFTAFQTTAVSFEIFCLFKARLFVGKPVRKFLSQERRCFLTSAPKPPVQRVYISERRRVSSTSSWCNRKFSSPWMHEHRSNTIVCDR